VRTGVESNSFVPPFQISIVRDADCTPIRIVCPALQVAAMEVRPLAAYESAAGGGGRGWAVARDNTDPFVRPAGLVPGIATREFCNVPFKVPILADAFELSYLLSGVR
jgi:hypothetical protein